jgi:choline transport protein
MIGNFQTASRLTWAFGRDDAVIFSRQIGKMNHRLEVPVNALLANSILVLILGCVYLASTTAFNAMIGTGLIMQQLSIAFPAAILLFRGRSEEVLPKHRPVRLGPFGWVANILTVVFAIIVLVFYDFPFVRPVTVGNMSKFFGFFLFQSL